MNANLAIKPKLIIGECTMSHEKSISGSLIELTGKQSIKQVFGGGQCSCKCSKIYESSNNGLYGYFMARDTNPSDITTVYTTSDRKSLSVSTNYVKKICPIGIQANAVKCKRKCFANNMLYESCD